MHRNDSLTNSLSLSLSSHAVAPDELTITGRQDGSLTEGDELELVCSASESWPQPRVQWLLNNIPLFSSSRVEIDTDSVESDSGLYLTTSTLSLSSVIPEDTGNYTCVVSVDIPDTPPLSRVVSITVQGE